MNDKLFITVNEAAKMLNFSPRYVRSLCRTDSFPAMLFGNRYMINANLLRQWADQQVTK